MLSSWPGAGFLVPCIHLAACVQVHQTVSSPAFPRYYRSLSIGPSSLLPDIRSDFFFCFVCLEEDSCNLNAEHVAEAAKEGNSKTKDGDRDGNAGVSGTLFGGSDFRADEVGDGVAAALGLNLLDHGGNYRGGDRRWVERNG